jgi:hypothetical protein
MHKDSPLLRKDRGILPNPFSEINRIKKFLNLDNSPPGRYNLPNFIGQFVTILSVNKTRILGDGRSALIFCFVGTGGLCPFLFLDVIL